jgi:hypothetical protein
MPGIDPISAGLSAVQTGVGIFQSISGIVRGRKAERGLERMVNNYKPNQSIKDYYSKALQRYNVNPYSSAMYRMQNQQAQRGLATGIGALQDRRSALAGVSSLVQGYNDSNLKAAAGAEAQQGQALSQLGQATQMNAAEDKYKFENKYNLLAMKAAGGNQQANAGLSNVMGGLSSAAQLNQLGSGGGSEYIYNEIPRGRRQLAG